MRAAILTVSDRCARGEAADVSGPAVREALEEFGAEIVESALVADEAGPIKERLTRWSDEMSADVVFTVGGTGLGPRDVTPEATEAVLDRRVPGIAEAMRAGSLTKTRWAVLSRATAGVRGRTLIVNLPGSPRGARECLELVLPVLEHAVEMMAGEGHCAEARGNERPGTSDN